MLKRQLTLMGSLSLRIYLVHLWDLSACRGQMRDRTARAYRCALQTHAARSPHGLH